ncbi:hypothetical protein RHGRI_022452 [Rhododendron griersonianum]|uniref:Uncharacterized protein n=1 Tax=Rhododendron griersonianum TaxID=479676 RepID=A0AAV6J015_9ERIC|nr:hypothetical protein RHGRI_022452 [Rhododendron griersonianum]
MAALVLIHETPQWKKLLSYVGPGFLVSVAYLDPGNLQTDLQAGANHKYELLWIVLAGLTFALLIQSRSANLGVVTDKEAGGGNRDPGTGGGRVFLQHNLFLHSALVISRKIPHSSEGIRSARKYFLLESSLALFIAFLINVAVISVSGSVCWNQNLSSESKAQCENITLNSAAFLLKNSLGKWSSKVYAISLLASGQSSTVTGTYAGQYIMQGFLDLKMKLWLRNLVTRFIAIAPSLVICIIGGASGASRLIIIASMILSFELPFALVPLLRFTSSEAKMGPHKSSVMVTFTSWILGFCSIGINLYFLSATVMGRITDRGHSSKASSIVTGVFVFPTMVLYVALLAYLTLKKETPVTIGSPPGLGINNVTSSESEFGRRSDGIQKVHGMEGDDIVSAA